MKTDKLDLESEIVSAAHSAIITGIKKQLEGYNSPIDPLVKSVVEANSSSLRERLDGAVKTALSGDFAAAMEDACAKKLAKVLISKMEGEIEKQANELRSSPEFRAKLTVAISEVVKSFKA